MTDLADLYSRFPERADALRRKRDASLESQAMDLVASIIKPDLEFRNLYYPNPEQHGNLTELDGLLAVDDLLFLVESKAGGLSAAANRGAPDSLGEDSLGTIGKGQRQAERAEAFLKSADEVAFFDSSG